MSAAALQHGANPATTVQTQMEPVAEQVNVIHITRMAGGFADVRLLLVDLAVRVHCQTVHVAKPLSHASREELCEKSVAGCLSWWLPS